VEQVTGQPISNVQGPAVAESRPSPSPRLGLPAFLPGGIRDDTPPTLPLPRPLLAGGGGTRKTPREAPGPSDAGDRLVSDPQDRREPSQALELERVYLSYLLLHLDRLAEPALKYLRHAVEQECSERGWEP